MLRMRLRPSKQVLQSDDFLPGNRGLARWSREMESIGTWSVSMEAEFPFLLTPWLLSIHVATT